MDHLGIPEEYRERAIIVPYLGIAKRYDRQGFFDFPERCGLDIGQLMLLSKESFEAQPGSEELLPFESEEHAESFFQEWLWFGMLHEFEIACGVPMDVDAFIKPAADGNGRILNTESLVDYARNVMIDLLRRGGVPFDLKVGDWVTIKSRAALDSVHSEDGQLDSWTDTESANSGSVRSTSVRSEPIYSGFVRSGSVRSEQVRSGSRRSRSIRSGEVEDGSIRPRSVRSGSAEHGSTSVWPLPLPSHVRNYQIKKDLGNLRYTFSEDYKEGDYSWPASSLNRIEEPREETELSSETTLDLHNISLRTLRELLEDLYWQIKPEPQSVWRLAGTSDSQISRCLREVRKITTLSLHHRKSFIRDEVIFSIDALCNSLGRAARDILQEISNVRVPWTPFYNNYLVNIMKDRYWCRARIYSGFSNNLLAMYFTSLLPSHETTSHHNCGVVSCLHWATSVEGMHAQHDTASCDSSCPVIVFEERDLVEILEAGGIPGICQTTDSNGETIYQAIDITGREYIAISHVWSHGLGNPSKNALPRCQIKRLFELIEKIGSPNVLLWIDTLAVPIDLVHKRLAIMKLRMVYENATSVLAVDRDLVKVGSHWLERRIQLLCSEWMRRLWTLQEGRLASTLYIQYRDSAVPVMDLAYIFSNDAELQDDSDIFGGLCYETGVVIETHFSKRQHLGHRFLDLVKDLSHRSVTVATDEPICLATMMGLALERYKPYPTMVDIYRSLRSLPPDLLFLSNPKMKIPGFGWAPATYLEQKTMPFGDSDIEEVAELIEEGLKITKNCIIFKEDLHIDRYHEEFIVREDGEPRFVFYPSDEREEWKHYKKAGLILNQKGSDFDGYTQAVVVSNLDTRDDITYCKFEMNLLLRRWDGLTEQGIPISFSDQEDVHIFNGEFQLEVTFCVD